MKILNVTPKPILPVYKNYGVDPEKEDQGYYDAVFNGHLVVGNTQLDLTKQRRYLK